MDRRDSTRSPEQDRTICLNTAVRLMPRMPLWRVKLLLFFAVANARDTGRGSLTTKLKLSQLGEQLEGFCSAMHSRARHSCRHSHKYPPVGAIYAMTLGMPVIGDQMFIFRIKSLRRGDCSGEYRGRGQITLKGAMNLNEPADFYLHSDGTIDMRFNETTLALLSCMRTRIVKAAYSMDDDSTELVIAPPLWRHIRVKLQRCFLRDLRTLAISRSSQ